MTPFMQSSARFESSNAYKQASQPGPGHYKIVGFAEESLRRAIVDVRKKPAFGQSASRSLSLAKKDSYYSPGPAQYDREPLKTKKEAKSSTFASTTKQHETKIEVNELSIPLAIL
jgi:hypothetical protein